jgi:MFS family permease
MSLPPSNPLLLWRLPRPRQQGYRNPGTGYLVGLGIASVAVYAASLGTAILTLQLKANELDPENATTQLSIVSGVAGVFALIGNPMFGRLSDRTTSRFGRRRPYLVLGAFLFLLGAVICLIASNTPVLTAGWVVMTLGLSSAQAGIGATIADQLAPERRGPASALYGIAGGIGAVVGLFLAQLVAPSFAAMFLLPAAVAAVGLIVFAALLKDEQLPVEARPRTSAIDVVSTFWVNPIRNSGYALAFGSRLLIFFAVAAVNGYQALYMIIQLHIPPAEVGQRVFQAGVVLAAISLLTAPLAGKISDKVGRRKPFVIASAVVFAVGLVIVARAQSFEEFLIGFAIVGLGQGVYFAVDFALVTQVLPDPTNTAKDLGIMALANSLPSILVPAIAPALLAIGASPHLPPNFSVLFYAGAAAGLIGALLIVPIRKVR